MKNYCLVVIAGLLTLGFVVRATGQSTSALDQADATATAGRADDAIQQYRTILQQAPDNAAALSALSDLLQANGRWRDAVPVLERLVKLNPKDAALLYQLGRYKSWESEKQRDQGLELLHRACDYSDHNVEYCGAYAETLSWRQETRAEGVMRLQQIVAAHPDNVYARARLGRTLSWNSATRPRALEVFDEGLKIDARNVDLLLASAEVLSWNRATRPEALSRYDRVLQQQKDNVQALNGKAQLLAWNNQTADALALYQQVLSGDPKNPTALRGKAEILNWKGHYQEARLAAEQAHAAAPSDSRASLELARAYVGLQKFAEARQAVADVNGNPTPDFSDVRNEIQRGSGTYMELGYAFRQEPTKATGDDIEYHRFDMVLSAPIGPASRASFIYQPTLFNNFQQGFNSNYFGAGFDSTWSDRFSTHALVGAEQFNNVPVNVDGEVGMNFKPFSSTVLKLNFQRRPVVESLLSTEGQSFNGTFFGQVFSNLADIGIGYDNTAHKLDFSLDYTDGVYTGHNLDSNRRYSVEAQAGRTLHGDQPYVHVGYYGNYTSFDHDADFQPGQPLTPLTGGYFSPTRYLLNQGVLTIGYRFSKNVSWGMSGAAGGQNAETNTTIFSNAQFADNVETHFSWRVTPLNELKFGYAYLNTFNAFQRNLFQFSWRRYF